MSSTTISYFMREGQKPTVVFQSGLGDGKSVWKKVIDHMPDTISIFVYDRPGYGDSPNTSDPRDPCTISHELHSLLNAVRIPPPYVLVGHSLGGLDIFCYAQIFPKEVAGLVLLDPTHPSHWMRMKNDAPAQAALIKSLRLIAFTKAMRQEFDDQEGCLDKLDMVNPLAIPTSFLFSGQFKLEEKGPFEQMVRDLRKQWLLFFTNAQSAEISDSGHYLQQDAPDTVVHAIQGIIEVRERSNTIVR
ncbi:MAG: alpha/beta hydrolase [Thioploca sp.]|nr:alpha/beta hydrolase [Thioploca sp.]